MPQWAARVAAMNWILRTAACSGHRQHSAAARFQVGSPERVSSHPPSRLWFGRHRRFTPPHPSNNVSTGSVCLHASFFRISPFLLIHTMPFFRWITLVQARSGDAIRSGYIKKLAQFAPSIPQLSRLRYFPPGANARTSKFTPAHQICI